MFTDVWDAPSLSRSPPSPPHSLGCLSPPQDRSDSCANHSYLHKAGSCTVRFEENFRTSLTRARQLLRERQTEKQLQEQLNRQQSRVPVLTLTLTASRLANLELHLCIIGGSCHKYHFCRDKHVFVATNMCLIGQNTSFVATTVLSRQAYFCRDKRRVLS